RLAVQPLVDPVAPPADARGDDDGGRERVGECRKPDAAPPARDVGAERPEGDRSPQPQAAAPDVERGDRALALAEVELWVGEDVVEAPADEPERHRPDRDV